MCKVEGREEQATPQRLQTCKTSPFALSSMRNRRGSSRARLDATEDLQGNGKSLIGYLNPGFPADLEEQGVGRLTSHGETPRRPFV